LSSRYPRAPDRGADYPGSKTLPSHLGHGTAATTVTGRVKCLKWPHFERFHLHRARFLHERHEGFEGENTAYFHSALALFENLRRVRFMCRNIKPLFNFEPPVSEQEILAASLQFVRKISGFNKPSKANETVFQSAVADIAHISSCLLASLESPASPRNRQVEMARMKARSARRFGQRSLTQTPP